MAGIGVLLVDDHAVVRAGYRRLLEGEAGIRVVGEADGAEQGYAAFCQLAPDVSVIDLSMPGMGGLELIRRILGREPAARLLVFSMHEDALFAVRALQAGARGYICKASPPETLVDALRQVHDGKVYLGPGIAQQLARDAGAARGDPLAVLSGKEFEVFRMLAEGGSSAEIAAAMNLSQKTIANYQTLIKDKLGVGTTAALVHLAARHGVIRLALPE